MAKAMNGGLRAWGEAKKAEVRDDNERRKAEAEASGHEYVPIEKYILIAVVDAESEEFYFATRVIVPGKESVALREATNDLLRLARDHG